MMDQVTGQAAARRLSDPRVNRKVVFIGTAAHSGSTLLGLTLGAHPSIFYAGEANKTQYFDNPSVMLTKRVCKVCGPGCVVWGELRVAPGQDLYEVLARRTRRPLIFDSTKDTEWIKLQVAVLRGVVPLYLIVLSRDGRAVVNSWLRKRPEIAAHEHAARWVERMRDVGELAAQWPGPVHRLRYEEFALRPVLTLRAVAGFLDVAFDPAMSDPWDSEQHPLGSNNGPLLLLLRKRSADGTAVFPLEDRVLDRYGAHPHEFVLDLRWKQEMSAEALAAFEAVAGETNRAYAWE